MDPTLVKPLTLGVKDMASDGHHPAVRFVTKDYNGHPKYWSWHHNYDNAPNWKYWTTEASYNGGMFAWTVEVANFDGSRILNRYTCPWVHS
ncbi:hypothetical protein ACWCP6_06430 [Streptomyces sp. NPDC002004]